MEKLDAEMQRLQTLDAQQLESRLFEDMRNSFKDGLVGLQERWKFHREDWAEWAQRMKETVGPSRPSHTASFKVPVASGI